MKPDAAIDLRTCSLVRMLPRTGNPVGTGILVTRRHLLTCTHVVLDAQGNPSASTAASATDMPCPNIPVRFELPFLPQPRGRDGNALRLHAKPIRCKPLPPPGFQIKQHERLDMALLEVLEPEALPIAARPASLCPSGPFSKRSAETYGFDWYAGTWVALRLIDHTAAGLVQVNRDAAGQPFAQQGFSGAPVWDAQGAVLGMLSIRRWQGSTETALMIPASHLGELLDGAGLTPPPPPDPPMDVRSALRQLIERLKIWDSLAERRAFLQEALGPKHPALLHTQLEGKQFAIVIDLTNNLLHYDRARDPDGLHGVCGLLRVARGVGWDQTSELTEPIRILARAFDCPCDGSG